MNSTLSKRNWSVLLIFGLIGQIAWSVENMYFNLFVYDTISKNLDAVTLMVQASGIAATVVTLIAGTLSDKLGNRRSFISIGYVIWGVTVALFGFISPELMEKLFNTGYDDAVFIALCAVVIGDCVMTLFGSSANDAAFNAWITDNTKKDFRGKVESVVSVLPLFAMLIVAGGFGILVELIGSYSVLFLILGLIISGVGIWGIFAIKDAEHLEKNGSLRDMIYGFKPNTVKKIPAFYLTLLITCIYSIACQIFMPYLIIYMRTYLSFSVIEYSLVFGVAIVFGAAVNLVLGRITDKVSKVSVMYIATAIFSLGLFFMYFVKGINHTATLILFGIAGFVMITGFIFISALTGAIIRDNTPVGETGKLQGIRMIFCVLIPMLAGPSIGNAINKKMNVPLLDAGADAMTTEYIPAPEIFLVAAIVSCLLFILIPMLRRLEARKSED